MFVECRLVSPRTRGFFHKVGINRVRVDFIEVQVVFCRHSKRPGAFFLKLPSMDCGLILPKVQGFFAKFTSSDHPCVRSEKACIWQSSYVSMLWYMQCVNVWGDLTRYQYTLSGLVLQKSWGVFYRFVIRGVQIDFTKAHRVLCGATYVECGLILLELRGFFCLKNYSKPHI